MNSYDFHSIVGLRLETDSAAAADFYRNELAQHAGEPAAEVPLVELQWNHSWLPRSPGPGYQLQMHKRLARWYYRMELEPKRVILDCAGNRTSIAMAWHMLVEPSMRYLAAGQGCLMLHGAGVVLGERSLVLTGLGGAGKTSTSSVLLRHDPDWTLHSDDYVFLKPGGTSLAFGTRAHAYLDLLKWLPELRSRLTAREQLEIAIFGLVRRFSGDRLKLPVRMPLARMWNGRQLSMQADLGAILLLGERTTGELAMRRLSPKVQAVDALIEMNFGEAAHFVRLARKFLGHQRADEQVARWREQERQVLERILEQVPVFEVHVPTDLGTEPGKVDRLVGELRQLVTGG